MTNSNNKLTAGEKLQLSKEIDLHIKSKSHSDSSMAAGYPSYPGPTSASVKLPSGEVLGACNRQTYYKIMGYSSDPLEARALKIFKFGKLIEDVAKDYLKEMGVYKTSGIRFYLPDIRVKGELDFVVCFPEMDSLIIENKSFYGYQQNANYRKGEPKIENVLQTFIYTYVFREGNEYGFEPIPGGGKILYWSRDELTTFDFSVYPVEIDGDWFPRVNGVVDTRISINNIKERFTELWSYLAKAKTEQKIPPRDFDPAPSDEDIEAAFAAKKITKTAYNDFIEDPSDFNRKRCAPFQCNYCSFYNQCMSEE